MEKHYCSIIDFDEEKKRLEETEFDKLWDEIYESYKNKMTYLEKNFNKEYTKSNLSSLILLHNEIYNKSIIIAYNKKKRFLWCYCISNNSILYSC